MIRLFCYSCLVGTWDFLKGVFSKIESVEVSELKLALRKSENLKESWKIRTEQLMERIFNSKQRLLFIIDELPDMLNGVLDCSVTEYETFLHWFRNTRTKSLESDVRWLLGGSVNLIASLDQQGKVKLINDLKVEPLCPFNKDEVYRFVTDMLKKHDVTFDNSVAPRVWELLGEPIPFFLQMLTQELYRKWKRNRSVTITADVVTEVFNKALLGEMARDKLQHYRTRIDTHYHENEREAVCYLLSKLSISDNGISRSSLLNFYRQVEEKKTGKRKEYALNQAFQRLLLYLQSDFYIEEKENGIFDFASHLLKIWWKKYYGYEYGDNKND